MAEEEKMAARDPACSLLNQTALNSMAVWVCFLEKNPAIKVRGEDNKI